MSRMSLSLLLIGVIMSLCFPIANAQAYFPSEIIQLGDFTYPWGVTSNPYLQNKGSKFGLEVNFSLPPLPPNTTCKLALNLPNKWNDNNSTWTAFFASGSACIAINIIDGAGNASNDTLADPAPSTPYGFMTLSLPANDGTGLDVVFEPEGIPCCANLLLVPEGEEEFVVSWEQHPDTAEGSEMLAYRP